MNLIPYEQEVALLDCLKQTLGFDRETVIGHTLRWDELPSLHPQLAGYDPGTLRFYVSMLAAAGFFLGFEDDGECFSIQRGAYDYLSMPGHLNPPLYRRYRERGIGKVLFEGIVLSGLLIWILRTLAALLSSHG